MRVQTGGNVERLHLFAILLFLLFRVVDAPLRYSLTTSGLGLLTSLPNVLMLGLLTVGTCRELLMRRVDTTFLAVVSLLGWSAVIGTLFIGNPRQVLLALYTLLPLLFGIQSSAVFTENLGRMKLIIACLWAVAVAGVFLSIFVDFPWTGFSYDRFGIEVEGSRDWSTFGLPRFAGFSRVSYEAATVILLTCLMLEPTTEGRWAKAALWIATGAAIAVTTTKGLMGAYLLLLAWLATRRWRRLWQFLTALIGTVMIALPVSTAYVKYNLGLSDIVTRFILVSFEDRLLNTWPDVLRMVGRDGSVILGRGLGGIGGAQKFFEAGFYNPADNLFLYLYVLFGVGSFVIIFLFLRRICRLLRGPVAAPDTFRLLLSLSVLSFGLTANVIESPAFAFAIGAALPFPRERDDEGSAEGVAAA
jgi:hypothetical protein